MASPVSLETDRSRPLPGWRVSARMTRPAHAHGVVLGLLLALLLPASGEGSDWSDALLPRPNAVALRVELSIPPQARAIYPPAEDIRAQLAERLREGGVDVIASTTAARPTPPELVVVISLVCAGDKCAPNWKWYLLEEVDSRRVAAGPRQLAMTLRHVDYYWMNEPLPPASNPIEASWQGQKRRLQNFVDEFLGRPTRDALFQTTPGAEPRQ